MLVMSKSWGIVAVIEKAKRTGKSCALRVGPVLVPGWQRVQYISISSCDLSCPSGWP